MIYNIKDYGAVGDGRTLNTQVIQNTIDESAKNGGGTVYVSDGVYMTGSITLKSNICLHIQANATLLGSPDCRDYPEKTGLKHVLYPKTCRESVMLRLYLQKNAKTSQ